jgi:flagellar biosynthesis anti-sigma factor FlgM
MRIDSNQAAQVPAENTRTSSQSPAGGESGPSVSNPLGEDQAQLSDVHTQVQALVAQVAQLPEIRQEKVNALRQVVLEGGYQPSSKQVGEAVFAHMVAMPAA